MFSPGPQPRPTQPYTFLLPSQNSTPQHLLITLSSTPTSCTATHSPPPLPHPRAPARPDRETARPDHTISTAPAMAAPSTPRGSPKLGPAFSPKATVTEDAAAGVAGPSRDSGSEAAQAAHAGGTCSVRCPYCDETLPASLLAHIRATEELDPAASEGLQKSVQGGDGAETGAAKAGISAADIRRWSERAGLELPAVAPVDAPPSPKDHAKPIPILPPPPSSSKSAASKSKSRFGFFSRKDEEDEEDDDDDLDDFVTGYAKLDEGPEDDDTYEEKPIVFRKREAQPEPEAQQAQSEVLPPQPAASNSTLNDPTLAVAAGASEPELRLLLKEVLGRISSLVSYRMCLVANTQSRSHEELATSHSTLLTSLKIARSNLVMAEANTEMLESELKRAKAEASAASAASASASATTPIAAPRPRPSLEGRPSGETASPRAPPLKEKSFGFWARKASPLPSPSLNNSVSAPADGDELSRLREQVATQATQLDTLKQGKREIEAELEGLSQALFEEANKMVADERRRRAELEENLREARDEREALRATIKVLGGSAPGTEANSDDETERSSNGGDLTAHYAALRAGIDRVGARTPQPPGRVTVASAAAGIASSPMPGGFGASSAGTSGSKRPGASAVSPGAADKAGDTETPEVNGNAGGDSGDGAGSATPSREPSPSGDMPGAFGSSASPPKDGPKGTAAMNMPPLPVPLETEANPWG